MRKSRLLSGLLALAIAFTATLAGATAAGAKNVPESKEKCWIGSSITQEKVLSGTLGSATLVGRWCSSNGTITSARYLAGWAETSTPFYTAIPNKHERGSGIVKNQARIWEEFQWLLTIDTAWITVTKPKQKCVRIKGYTDGHIRSENKCSIY